MEKLREQGVTSFALDAVPRTTLAQTFDTLSSMANLAGYKAVLTACAEFERVMAGQMTAGGKLPPSKVLVIGGGVAGLAAIQTAKQMGAIVRCFDTRSAVKEQVASFGAQFLEIKGFEEAGEGAGGYAKQMSDEFLKAEYKLFENQCKEVDIVITTALIPGKPAPKLIKDYMVDQMKPGSVIVDLAAENGGNCDYTKPGEIFVTDNGVKIMGYTDFPSRLPAQSSLLFSNNVFKFFQYKVAKNKETGEETYNIDLNDFIVRTSIITQDKQKLFPNPVPLPALDAGKKPKKEAKEDKPVDHFGNTLKTSISAGLGLSALFGVGVLCPDPAFLSMMSIFGLAVVGG